MNELTLFAGAGGGLLATHHLLGWRCVGYVEMAEYPCKVLEARINDELLSPAPIFQMRTSEFIRLGLAELYQGVADIITAGFPCVPFSRAGERQGGDDERNGWPDTIAIIRIVQPKFVLLENVSTLVSSGYFGVILGDLAASGYDCRWDCIPAQAIGANHERDRVWIVAYTNSHQCQLHQPIKQEEWMGNDATRSSQERPRNLRNTSKQGLPNRRSPQMEQSGPKPQPERSSSKVPHPNQPRSQRNRLQRPASYRDWWEVEPRLGRVVDGLANRVERVKAIGNGQVPAVVSQVWRLLKPGKI